MIVCRWLVGNCWRLGRLMIKVWTACYFLMMILSLFLVLMMVWYVFGLWLGKVRVFYWLSYLNSRISLLKETHVWLFTKKEERNSCMITLVESLLDLEETGSLPSLLHSLSAHESTITGLLTTPSNHFPVLISSSLDRTCKVMSQ